MGQQEAGPARAGLFVFGGWGIAVLGLALCAQSKTGKSVVPVRATCKLSSGHGVNRME